nr:hypothetical protein [Candidatus Sigynarchaeota archaeon]
MSPARFTSRNMINNKPYIIKDFFTIVYLSFSIFVFVVYPLVGFYIENGYFDLEVFFTGSVFGPSRLTFLDMITDVEQLLANFVTIVLFCLVSAFFFNFYGYSAAEIRARGTRKKDKRSLIICGLVAIGILSLVIVLSASNVGYDRPEFDGRAFILIIANFFPENFSVHVMYYFFLFSGLPGIFYMLASGYTRAKYSGWAADRANPGIVYMGLAIAVMEVMALAFPIITWDIVNAASATREMLFSLFDVLFITGIVLLLESRDVRKMLNDGKLTRETKPMTSFQWHGVAWLVPIAALLAVVAFIMVNQLITLHIGVYYFVSRVWSFAFMVCFTLFLYYLGLVSKQKRATSEVALNGA